MKKVFKVILLLVGFFVFGNVTYAETFLEGEYLKGEYINKRNDDKTYYMTMQFIKDSEGNIVYCLEPFVSFSEGKSYAKYESDLTSYKELDKVQKRKIELIIYYGYGYGNRNTDKWYAITQYLVWNIVDNNSDIYFTDKLNGKRVDKYKDEMDVILSDVNNHDTIPSFIKDYVVNLNDELVIKGLDTKYEIIDSDYKYVRDSYDFLISKVDKGGSISVRKISNRFKNNVAIFDSTNSQDLIKPGNVLNDTLIINVEVTSGVIELDIKGDNSIYTIESSLENTCYEIVDVNKLVIDKVCTSNDNLIYQTEELPLGEYVIKQVSSGVGYRNDNNLYKVILDEKIKKVNLDNFLLRNKIEIIKKMCHYDECSLESRAIFNIYNKNNELVNNIVTDENGYTFLELGYGSYTIKQIEGPSFYTLADPYSVKIVDEVTGLKKELFNYYIKPPVVYDVPDLPDKDEYVPVPPIMVDEEKEVIEDILPSEVVPDIEDVPENEEISPPKTGIDSLNIYEIFINIFKPIIGVVIDFFKNIWYI